MFAAVSGINLMKLKGEGGGCWWKWADSSVCKPQAVRENRKTKVDVCHHSVSHPHYFPQYRPLYKII